MKLNLKTPKQIYTDEKFLLFSIFILSVLCSSIFLFFLRNIGPIQHQPPGSDYLTYYEPMAYNILKGEGITLAGKVLPRIAPGWPIILSGIFFLSEVTGIDRLVLIIIFNVVLTALACCFLFLLAREIFNKKIGVIASFLWMTYPFNLWFIKNPNTEVPFIPLFFASIFLYVLALKKRDLKLVFLSGIVMGFASLIRIYSLFFPFILALIIFLLLKKESKKIKISLAVFLLVGYFLTIIPWNIYTSLKMGTSIPVSDLGNDSIFYGIILIKDPGGEGTKLNLSNDVSALIDRLEKDHPRGVNNILTFFSKELVNNPSGFFKLLWLKIIRPWYATSMIWWEDKILKVQLLYLITASLGVVYVFKKWKEKIINVIFILAIVLYFWIITALIVSILRYMVPVMGLVMIFSAVAVDRLLNKLNIYAKIGFSDNSL